MSKRNRIPMLSAFLLAILVSGAAPGQNPQAGTDPAADVDIAGVKLGMTPDEAIEALRKFDTWPVLNKRYISGSYGDIGVIGASDACKPRVPPGLVGMPPSPLRMMVAIIAAKGPRIPPAYWREYYGTVPSRFSKAQLAALSECGWSGNPAPLNEEEDPMEVAVYLSPIPGKERVIAVSLWKSFRNPPLVSAVLDNVLKRFPSDPTLKTSPGYEDRIAWRYDARGRVMSEAVARRSGALGALAGSATGLSVPSAVRQADGLAIDLYVNHDPRNPQIAHAYSLSLYTGRGLFDFVQQGKALYSEMLENKK